MLLPTFFLNCVVAIGNVATTLAPGAPPHSEWQTTGTGFFYGYLIKGDAELTKRQYEIYLVTARHVIVNRQTQSIQNLKEGQSSIGWRRGSRIRNLNEHPQSVRLVLPR